MNACALFALPDIREQLAKHRRVVIDGLYSWAEYKTLRDEFGNDLVVLAVCAPRAVRYARLATRSSRPLTPGQAFARDVHEIEAIEKGGPIAIADFTLVNDRDIQQLFKDLDGLLQDVFAAHV